MLKTPNDKQMEDVIPKQVLGEIALGSQALPMQVLEFQELWNAQKHPLCVKLACQIATVLSILAEDVRFLSQRQRTF